MALTRCGICISIHNFVICVIKIGLLVLLCPFVNSYLTYSLALTFFPYGFYGPFNTISLMWSRLLSKDKRKPTLAREMPLAFRKQNLTFSLARPPPNSIRGIQAGTFGLPSRKFVMASNEM